MHKAADGGSLDVIKFLAPLFGARVHEKDAYSFTVLLWAAEKGHCQVARYLITELKLDPQDRDKVRGCGGGAVPRDGKTCSKVGMGSFVALILYLCYSNILIGAYGHRTETEARLKANCGL